MTRSLRATYASRRETTMFPGRSAPYRTGIRLDIGQVPCLFSSVMDKLPVDLATAECLKVGYDEMKVLASTADNGGALFALEMRMAPGGGPPVMHRHASGEVYYVIEGEFTFHLGLGDDARRVTARAGDTVPL